MMRLLRLWRVAGRDLRLWWFALRHPDRPVWLWPAALALVCYAIEPFNFAIPVFGVIDELIIVPMLLHAALRWLPAGIRASFPDDTRII